MNISIAGAGYVGLVSAACFAEFGTTVTCIDTDSKKIDRLNKGELPIYEPGLDTLIARNVKQSRLRFTDSYQEAIPSSDLVFIAVGAPGGRGDGYADLSYVYQAAKDIAPRLEGYTVIVDKSTVPVGTARNVRRIVQETNPDADFDVASNPEFLREGAAISDFMRPDRVVVGAESEQAVSLMRALYRPLNLIETPILVTSPETAELIKYASNAFLATKISFINEMAALCDAVDADVHSVARGMGLDGRIGRKFLHPGPGYGGSCLPKDARALARMAQENNVASRIVEAVIEVNAAQTSRMLSKIKAALGGAEAGKTIATLGLTYKPETDDMREAPSLSILPELIKNGAVVRAHDPKGVNAAKKLLPPSILFFDDAYDAVAGADALLLITEWNAYRSMDLEKIKHAMRGKAFIDLRNVYEPGLMDAAGFDYHCVGRNGARD